MFKKFKIKNSKLKILFFLFFILASHFMLHVSVNAQTSLPKGLTVIPSIHYLDLGKEPAEYELKYINNTEADITLILSAQDFTELEEGYRINFLEGKDAENYKYSLSSWLTFENKNLELLPGEEKTIKIFIDKDRITRGGHYASIQAKVDQINSKEAININPVISSLLFVRASTGAEIENGKINTFAPSRSFLAFPKSFILRFQNSGNVHVIPYGKAEIRGPFGNKIVAKGILNEGSLNALPESIRRYTIETKTNAKILFPGIYSARADVHFGQTNQKLNQEIKFFSWGSFNFIKIGFVLIILAGVAYILRKRYKDK